MLTYSHFILPFNLFRNHTHLNILFADLPFYFKMFINLLIISYMAQFLHFNIHM